MIMFSGRITLRQPKLVYSYLHDQEPASVEISVILPVYNQQATIGEVINCLANSIESNFELIVIDDASTDLTCERIIESVGIISKYPNLVKAFVYKNSFSRFETFCDNFGVSISSGYYCLEVQSDMLINDPGFDIRLISAIEKNEKIALISGRGVEPLAPIIRQYKSLLGTDRVETKSIFKHVISRLIYHLKVEKFLFGSDESTNFSILSGKSESKIYTHPSESDFLLDGKSGRLGNSLNYTLDVNFPRTVIYLGETVMRGPLFFKTELIKKIGNFDIHRFFQGFDDHDLCARIMSHGYRVGYCPINFSSPLHLGTTRKKRSISTELLILFQILRIRRSSASSQLNNSDMPRLISQTKNQLLTF